MTTPEIHAYMPAANGGRRRSFELDGVRVIVEPHIEKLERREFRRRALTRLTTTPPTPRAIRV